MRLNARRRIYLGQLCASLALLNIVTDRIKSPPGHLSFRQDFARKALATLLLHPSQRPALTNLHIRLLRGGRLLRIHNALLNIARKAKESLLDIDIALGGNFHEGDA